MYRIRTAVLGAATVVAAFGLGGCGTDAPPAATTDSSPSPGVSAPSLPAAAPLPPPEALTDVLYRLADPAVPGAEKTDAVERATAGDAAALDNFGRALRDGGFLPVDFEATDVAWSDDTPGNVVATVAVGTPKPDVGRFTFPMEFTPADGGGWQLTRETADMLLEFGAPADPAEPAPAELPPAEPPPAAPAPPPPPEPAEPPR